MIINRAEYRQRVLGCWMGKNIGGTLGAPFEWLRQVNHVDFYTQDLGGEPLPNDDLDIQLLWLVALEEQGVALDAHALAEYWVLHVTPHWGEYGTAKINMRTGLVPPLSGLVNNLYKDSCGAFIRSEIWACLTPGFPAVAARYAYEDAILDHGDGEGVYAEVFCAALESAAFVEQDLATLVQIGLSYIPAECGVTRATRDAIACYQSGQSWQDARHAILAGYRGRNLAGCSADDRALGFADGPLGWDVPSNIGMLIIALLYGEDDFGQTLCTAVNCGEDTDCTAATAGAIWGIRHGFDAIPQHWTEPIGRKIKIATLNLGEFGFYGNGFPGDIDNLTDRTMRLAHRVIQHHRLPLEMTPANPTDLSDLTTDQLMAGTLATSLYDYLGCPVFRFQDFVVAVDYGGDPTIRDGAPKTLRLSIRNTSKVQANLHLRWYVPDNWRIHPGRTGMLFSSPAGAGYDHQQVEFQVETDRMDNTVNRLVVELVIDSRPTAMLVPILLLDGNVTASAFSTGASAVP